MSPIAARASTLPGPSEQPGPVSRLHQLDLSKALDADEERSRLEVAWSRLSELRLSLGGQRPLADPHSATHQGLGPPVCVVFEGWDAAGKGGAIRRLVQPLDPRHVKVSQFAAPTHDERRHHFLWRFWPHIPGWGGMSVLDRSWYGRVLVERVEGFASDEEVERAYGAINAFEESLAEEGMILIKFWLEISDAEQLKRFERRDRDPLKSWKLTDEDWRNREKRPAYESAVEEMLERTDRPPTAGWHLIEANSKRFARVKVLETVIAEIEDGMRRYGIDPPPAVAEDS